MIKILSALAIGLGAALATAPSASAAPLTPVNVPVLMGGRVSIGFGTGFGQSYSSGYYVTQYQWVQVPVIVGYDRGYPVYQTQWVQQPYQVWVPTVRYEPSFSIGFGYGFGGGGHHRHHR